MEKIFFTADTHFFHENAIRFDSRPWGSLQEMHKEMLRRWNNKVSNSDHVYILGDFAWKTHPEAIKYLKEFHGNLHLIVGNHDSIGHKPYRDLFTSIKDYDQINVQLKDGTSRRCVLSHYYHPFYNGHRYGAIMLHGHSHVSQEANLEREITAELNHKQGFDLKIFNVGCMYYNYAPVTLDEILENRE